MKTNEILKAIKRLPVRKRIYLIEKAIHSIREQEEKDSMEKAVNTLSEDYKNDKKLTEFTTLDFENFYEAR